jgi:hypothetical protein
MSKVIKYNDFVQINPDSRVLSLDKRDKIKLIDNILERSNAGGKGLLITYDLSHSGRRINNRIYSTAGQQRGIDSLTSPYPKPILKNHNQGGEPIGRFVDGEWQNLYDEASSYLQSSQKMLDIQSAFTDDDPGKIYSTLKSFNLLEDKRWPGLGRMRVQANITDEDAIKKFMDGRYLTFSAGSTTDRHVCSICESDWALDGICEHRHGKKYDGETCVFVTGDFIVMEGSVVNTPADDLSQIVNMQIQDSKEAKRFSLDERVTVEEIILTDSVYDFGETNELQATEEANLEKEDEEEKEEVKFDHEITIPSDAMVELHESGVAYVEVSSGDQKMIIKINYSGNLSEKSKDSIKQELFEKFKQNIIGDFDLDKIKYNVHNIENKILKDFLNKEKGLEMEDQNNVSSEALEENEISTEEISPEASEKDSQEKIEVPDQVEPEDESEAETLDDSLEWELMDLALESLVKDSEGYINSDERKELPESVFCGPSRSFPIPNRSYVDAAKELISKLKDSNSFKEELLNRIEEKASLLKSNDYLSLENKFNALKSQYEDLENKFKSVLESVLDKKEEKNSEKVETKTVDTVIEDKDLIIDNKVENPSEHVESEEISSKKENKLPAFEQKIVNSYKEILTSDGELAAESYLNSQASYLPRGFNPNKF